MTGKTITVTPAQAMKWLEGHINYRKLDARMVRQHAADMLSGAWKLNGEAIKFDKDGKLVDGQHRLSACIEANVPFETYAVYGVDPAAVRTMDNGKQRTVAQHAKHIGNVKEPSNLCAAGRILVAFEEMGQEALRQWRWVSPSRQTILAWVEKHHAETRTDLARSCFWRMRQFIHPSVGIVCSWIILGIEENKALEFLDKIADPSGLLKTHPAVALRERLIRAKLDKRSSIGPNEQAGLFLKAFWLFRSNRSVSRLLFDPESEEYHIQ